MKLNTVMVINAIAGMVFGLGFIFAPAQTMSLYEHAPTANLSYMAQLLGAALLSLGLLTWAARNSRDSDARRAILLALAVGYAIDFVLAVVAQVRGAENVLGWSTVATYLFLALAFGYFRFARPASQGSGLSRTVCAIVDVRFVYGPLRAREGRNWPD